MLQDHHGDRPVSSCFARVHEGSRREPAALRAGAHIVHTRRCDMAAIRTGVPRQLRTEERMVSFLSRRLCRRLSLWRRSRSRARFSSRGQWRRSCGRRVQTAAAVASSRGTLQEGRTIKLMTTMNEHTVHQQVTTMAVITGAARRGHSPRRPWTPRAQPPSPRSSPLPPRTRAAPRTPPA